MFNFWNKIEIKTIIIEYKTKKKKKMTIRKKYYCYIYQWNFIYEGILQKKDQSVGPWDMFYLAWILNKYNENSQHGIISCTNKQQF